LPPICGMRRLPEGSRRDTGGVSVTEFALAGMREKKETHLGSEHYFAQPWCGTTVRTPQKEKNTETEFSPWLRAASAQPRCGHRWRRAQGARRRRRRQYSTWQPPAWAAPRRRAPPTRPAPAAQGAPRPAPRRHLCGRLRGRSNGLCVFLLMPLAHIFWWFPRYMSKADRTVQPLHPRCKLPSAPVRAAM